MKAPPGQEKAPARAWNTAPGRNQSHPQDATNGTRFQAETYAGLDSRLPKDCMRFLLPHGLNPNLLDWGKGNRPAKIAYVAHLLSTRRYDDFRDYVTLHSPTVKEAISAAAWQEAREKLGHLMEIDHSYQVSERSKGYRWNESLRNQDCIAYIIRCPAFKRYLASVMANRLANLGPVEQQVNRDLRLLDCGIHDIENFLRSLPDKPGTKNEAHRRSVFKASILQIFDRSYGRISRDRNGRIHHALTRTPRDVRKQVTLAEEEAVEIDLANSQIYFMAPFFGGSVPGLACSVCEGTFYADINRQLDCPFDLSDSEEKGALKRQCLMRIYAKPLHGFAWYEKPGSTAEKITGAMDAAFPGLPKCLDEYRFRHGATSLANAMQRRESSVFIDTVLPALQRQGIPAIPIHDSFLCRKSHAEQVARSLEDELVRATGLHPLLRIG